MADAWRNLPGLSPADKLCLGLSAMGKFREAGTFQDELLGLRKDVCGPAHYSTKSAENHFEYDEWAGKRQDSVDVAKDAIVSAFKAANIVIDEKRAEAAAFEQALTLCTQECVQEASE